MPRTVNPASLSVGAGLAPQGTVEDNSLRYPQRDVDPLRAHLVDPNKAHMAAAIGIVDAGGFFASDEVEGALQELGGGGGAGRHNGLVLGGTFTSGPGLLTLDSPTQVLIGGVLADFGGATVVLPPSATRYVWVDPTTSTLTASAVLPPVSDEPVLIAKVVTDAGANVTSSQDARFFVANLDRKVDYSLRSDGSAVNDASEACFVTLDAALFWLENYVATAQERKALILVRGEHVISSTVLVPAGVPNIEFRGEGAAEFATGAALTPMFNVSGTVGLTFTGVTCRCAPGGGGAGRTATGALACSNVTVQSCRFTAGLSTWDGGVVLDAATPAIQQGHRVLNSQVVAVNSGVVVTSAVDCVVRDCTLTGTNTLGSTGVGLSRVAGTGENCTVENVRVVSGFTRPFDLDTFNSALRGCQASGGGSVVGGAGFVVDGCALTDTTSTTAGLEVTSAASGSVVSNTTVATTTAWAGADDPAGVLVAASGVTLMGCTVDGFDNPTGGLGAGVRFDGVVGGGVTATTCTACHTGVEVLNASSTVTVTGCTLSVQVRGVYSDNTSSGTRVTGSTVTLDSTTGLHGVVSDGLNTSVVGCRVTTARAFNSYVLGDVPAGVLCSGGRAVVSGCDFNGLYDSTSQVGGGVVHTGTVLGLTVADCVFNNCGVGSTAASSLSNLTVTGCTFNASAAGLLRMGVDLLINGGPLLDANVSDCTFNFLTTTTGPAVSAQADTLRRFVLANCTYTAASAPGGVERFANLLANTAGEGVVIEGNTVNFPADNALGPLLVQGVDTLTVANNVFLTATPAASTVLGTNAGAVSYTGNTSVGMNGIALTELGGVLPSLQATGNTFDGADDTTAVGIRVVSVNAPLTASNTRVTGNTFTGYLNAVVFTNTLNTLTLNGLSFTGNVVSGSRTGLTTDADSYSNVLVADNTFNVYNYAVYQSNSASVGSVVRVDGNTVVQSGFVAPPTALGLVTLLGAGLAGASVSDNTFDHEGAVSAITLVLSGSGPEDLIVDRNTVRNEAASAAQAIVVAATVSNALAPQVNNVSLSHNKVNHFGGGFAAIRLALTGTLAFNVFRNLRLDDNHVVVEQNNAANLGVILTCTGSVGANPSLRDASMCRNLVLAYGTSVWLSASEAASIENVVLCDNTTLAGNAGSTGAVQFTSTYAGVVPPTAAVNNLSLCRNLVQSNTSNYALRVTCLAPTTNLSVDDNSIQRVGDVANPSAGTGNIYLFLSNASAFPTRGAATGVSVCRNKVTGTGTTPNYGEAAILLTSTAGLTTEGKNLTVDDNEVYNHAGAAVTVQLGYDAVRNLSVSGNKVHTVEGQAILIERAAALTGLAVSNNLIEAALSAGGSAGDGTVTVDTLDGVGFTFAGNTLKTTSRRGFFVDGTSATATLDNVTFTGNTVDFTGGAGAAEEGLYLFWQANVQHVAVTGNALNSAATGVYIDGGLPASTALTASTVRRVAVTGNTVSATGTGVQVSNHTTDSGAGVSTLENVAVTGNTVSALTATGSMAYGALVDTVFGSLQAVAVTGNVVELGSTSTGKGAAVECNAAAPTGVAVTNNTVSHGRIGVQVLGDTSQPFFDVSLSSNRVDALDSVGVSLGGANALVNVSVDDNTVKGVDAGVLLTGHGLFVSTTSAQDSRNVSVSGNSVDDVEGVGILVQLLRGSGTPKVSNLSLCHNRVSNWNKDTTYAALTAAVQVTLCSSATDPHPLYNLNCSHNTCTNDTDDYVQGFDFTFDELTRQVVFSHNQVLLGNQANAGAMAWTFTNTGLLIVPKDFTFMGNLFRDTNSVVPSYTGTQADFGTFYGNIGSTNFFWTGFAVTNWATYVPNGAIATHNIDNGT
jgi:hypothetical protein